ncbi:HAD family hydrolase [Virgibacillus byunsanensis]|uniref:HAD family hydrolase n=1 Tax=Virgibacillus byunsanensis TaxID=570945 RepID=A0ABW3LN37_9BACI
MTYNILFLDIDGTILMPNHMYTNSTKEAIQLVKEQGIEVFLATGRPLHEIKSLAKELDVHSLIGYNGAYATYQDETIIDEPMNENNISQFLDLANTHGHEMVLYTSEKNYFTSLETPVVQHFIETFKLQNNELYNPTINNQILGATILNLKDSDSSQYEIDKNIQLSQVNVYGIENCYDVIRKSVNKGQAIKEVLKTRKLPKEGAIAFGDGMNDKEMLQSVGEGFAMGNAHPDLFAYAKHVTTDVSDSGIYNGLKTLGVL